MKRSSLFRWSRIALALLMAAVPTAWTEAPPKVDFARDVRPLLAEHCVKCHGPEKQKGGLRLDLKAALIKGGDDGKVIEPGRSGESKLIHFVEGRDPDKVMPPKGPRLTADQIGVLCRWIDEGANWPDEGKAPRARSEHWALQPLRMPVVPIVPGAATEI